MARVVKEYDERHAEFLDAAQILFYQQGYEQTSVQQIIRAVGVAKGTFYHYFSSKAELLDNLIKRMLADTVRSLEPVVVDASLTAVEKFEHFFAAINSMKLANRELMLDAVRVLYQDENVLLRTKMQTEATELVAPLLAAIIRQGIEEHVFDMDYPDEAAEILVRMGQGLSDTILPLILADTVDPEGVRRAERKVLAYDRSVERVLGAKKGSLRLVELEDLQAWFPEPKEE